MRRLSRAATNAALACLHAALCADMALLNSLLPLPNYLRALCTSPFSSLHRSVYQGCVQRTLWLGGTGRMVVAVSNSIPGWQLVISLASSCSRVSVTVVMSTPRAISSSTRPNSACPYVPSSFTLWEAIASSFTLSGRTTTPLCLPP
jgi:hypothetical protein